MDKLNEDVKRKLISRKYLDGQYEECTALVID